MTRTPWGKAADLRDRQLRPGYRLPREDVNRNQRERLMGAMVATVAERGYEATTVAHVVKLSGVSRTAFYRQFANKEECFLASVDAVVQFAMAAVTEAWQTEGAWDDRLRAALEAFVAAVRFQPAAAKVSFLDVFVAGPNALPHVDAVLHNFERMILQSFAESPERAEVPPLVVRGIVGGVHKVIFTRLRKGETDELPGLIDDLWRWSLTFVNPTEPIRNRTTRKSATLATPRFVAHDQVERIAAAMARVTARKSYAATTIEEVVSEASTSLRTFYNHFRTKEEAFLASYDVGLAQAFAAALPPYQRAEDWRQGARALAEAVMTYFTVEPDWARMGIVEALAAGPRGMERRDNAIAAFSTLLQPGLDEAGNDLPELAVEATGGGVYALLYDHVRQRGPERLLELQPAATYFALVPFVGPEEATAIANQRTVGRAPRKR